MNPWHDVIVSSTELKTFNAVIEIPKGTRQKIELDKSTGLYRVDRILQSSMVYPANYGFIPQTLSEDKDPLDVLVLGQDPIATGIFLECRAIGFVKMKDGGAWDEKIIAVHVNDPAVNIHSSATTLKQYIVVEIERFFNDYKKYEHKKAVTHGIGSEKEANTIIKLAVNRYNTTYGKEAKARQCFMAKNCVLQEKENVGNA